VPGIYIPPKTPPPQSSGNGSQTFHHMAGLFWPQGDPAGLRRAATAWRQVASALDGIESATAGIASGVRSHNQGSAIDAFGSYWSKWEGGGGYFGLTAQASRQMALGLEQYASAIEAARKRVEEIAAAAATVLAVGLLLTVVTVGISDAAAGAAAGGLAAAAAAVGVELSAEVATIAGTILAGAAIGAVASMAVDTAIQIEHIAGFHDQNGFNWSELGTSGAIGAVTGGAGSAVSLGFRALAPVLTDLSPAFSRAATAFSTMPDWAQAGIRGTILGGGMTVAVDEATTGKINPLDVALGVVGGASGDMVGTRVGGSEIIARINRSRAVDSVAKQLGIDTPEGLSALRQAYDVTTENQAPFIVKVANDMLANLKADVAADPSRRIVFVGRDGHSLAVAIRALDPAFFDAHASEVVLSRAVADSAIQDLELNAGRRFPELADFRRASAKVNPDDVTGSMRRLTEYLQRSGVPVGDPGSSVTLVDTSFKGTVQELLAAAFPDTSFHGRYVFFGASPSDPHPGTKVGYALNLGPDQSNGGKPITHLPADPSQTFAHQDAIGSIEETLHGPLGSPVRIDSTGPVQQPIQLDPHPTAGINPVHVQPNTNDPVVREGVMHTNLLAVKDYADAIGALQRHGVDVSGQLDAGFRHFQDQVHSWITGGQVDPRFQQFMDSFVRRGDKGQIVALDQAIRHAGLSPDQALPLWQQFDHLASVQAKQTFVAQFQQAHG
jgi:hypothetical protein